MSLLKIAFWAFLGASALWFAMQMGWIPQNLQSILGTTSDKASAVPSTSVTGQMTTKQSGFAPGTQVFG